MGKAGAGLRENAPRPFGAARPTVSAPIARAAGGGVRRSEAKNQKVWGPGRCVRGNTPRPGCRPRDLCQGHRRHSSAPYG